MKIYEAAALIKNKSISPSELVCSVLGRINEHESRIKAYITLAEDFSIPKEAVEGSPLWGIPIAVKDNLCTKGMLTTAGSRMLESFVPDYNATVVERLKKCGAVITGKTNMDEFGMGSDSLCSAFHVTKNPHNTLYVPGGSSGGSAAAVKAGMALASLGTDTGGSIRQPAAFCGIYALKPTYSLISRYGLIAFASSLDCIGPMANCVKDLAIVTDAITGGDSRDATSSNRKKESYYENIKPQVKNLKMGIPVEFFENADESVKKAVYTLAQKLGKMGAIVSECSCKSIKYATAAYYVIASAEASSNLARYDGVRFGYKSKEYESFEELCTKSRSEAFGNEVKKRIIFGTRVLSGENYNLYYNKANLARGLIKKELESLLGEYDVLLTPVCPSCVPKIDEKKDAEKVCEKDRCTAAVSLANLPAMSIPCGKDENGMPVGAQLIGNRFCEQLLFNVASACEEGGLCNV